MIIDFNSSFLDINREAWRVLTRTDRSWPAIIYLINYCPSSSGLRLRSAHHNSQLIFCNNHVYWSRGTTIRWRWDTRCEASTESISAGFDLVGLRSSMWWDFTLGRTWCRVSTVATLSSRGVIQFDVWIFCVFHNIPLSSVCFSTMSFKFSMYFLPPSSYLPIFCTYFTQNAVTSRAKVYVPQYYMRHQILHAYKTN